jgi:hypothetical protein
MKRKKLLGIILMSLVLCLVFGYFGDKVLIKKIAGDVNYNQISTVFDGALDLRSNQIKEGYRFYWDHSMGPAILITVYMDGEQPKLSYKIAVYADTEESTPREQLEETESIPRKVLDEKEILLTQEQLEILRKTVNDNRFWKENISKDFGLDGADWTIEVKRDGSYYRDFQWSPRNGAIRNIGVCLLELSPYDVKSNELGMPGLGKKR